MVYMQKLEVCTAQSVNSVRSMRSTKAIFGHVFAQGAYSSLDNSLFQVNMSFYLVFTLFCHF